MMPSADMNKRMAAVLLMPGNNRCSDCPAKHPLWASFLLSPYEDDRSLGVLCCTKCAQHHHFELGEKRTHIKCLKMAHEWLLSDIEWLEESGNTFVNACYEAKLTRDGFDKAEIHPDHEEEESRRAKFIKQKYKKLKFFDEVLYHEQILKVLREKRH
jgi:Putative GTPase activating protein for Arf